MVLRKASLLAGLLVLAITVGATTAAAGRAPTTPTNLRITGTTDTSISLAWNASTHHSANFW
jgi:hypothetical protein